MNTSTTETCRPDSANSSLTKIHDPDSTHPHTMKKLLTITLIAWSSTGLLRADHAPDHKTLINMTRSGVAIQGYDPVAYFTDKKPVMGSPKFTSRHDGVAYWFASMDHKVQFDAAPDSFVPAYGGYCGYAASINRLSPISPEWFQIVEGRLVLQHNKKAFDKWNAELTDNLHKADGNWPGLVAKHGTSGKSLLFTDRHGVALEGHDPVSYFTDNRPVKGDPKIEATFNGALYRFVSQEHRAMFENDPTKYTPAYGGFCGYAASIGKVRPANPLIWSIVDGQLVVQHTQGAADLWAKDVATNKAKADKLWPRLVEVKAGKKNPIDSLLGKSALATLD